MSAGSALSEQDLDLCFHALSQPRRRGILRLVGDREVAAGEIAAEFDVTRSAVSQHLTVLKDAGLLVERRDGTRRLYRTCRETLSQLHGALDSVWGSALDRGRLLAEEGR
ncbi:metalloregulator ArsR/SmtB family transcription factor [Brevibacterium sp.]|uniref:ArsR/SmtB family transcription factor n=1 Tax=Brevibacterium sp. TaxID=1701 RepID=UPI002811E2EF|nr:metalloregulator ArsR/SmtB family transcription factor [Brevibacterium sp.]